MDQGRLDVVTGFAEQAAERRTGIDVGTASVNWGFDPLYTWVRTPSFETMLDQMAQAGYAGTEISYNFPSTVAELRSALGARGLKTASTFLPLDLRDRAQHEAGLRRALDVAGRLLALGSTVLILSDAPTPRRLAFAGDVPADGSEGLDETRWRALAAGLQLVGAALAARGVRAVFHPHAGTFVETRAEIDRLLAITDPALIGLCPDTGHLAFAGVDVVQLFRDYAGRIAYVHLKDVDGDVLAHVRAQRLGFAEAVRRGSFVRLGAGVVDIPAIIEALRAVQYRGWLIVEQDAPPEPLAAAIANREYLRTVIGL